MNNIEYFYETEKPFEDFLQKIFGDKFKKKYSLTGNGIYYLLFIDGGIYEIEYKQARGHVGTKITDRTDINNYPDCGSARFGGPVKQTILYSIGYNLNTDEVYAKSAEMSFPVHSWIAKIKIVKKTSEPQ